MKITLKNNKYEVVLNSLGAEINSFRVLKNGTQLVFEGPTEVWKYHAPVLFPPVGRIKDGFYTYKEKKTRNEVAQSVGSRLNFPMEIGYYSPFMVEVNHIIAELMDYYGHTHRIVRGGYFSEETAAAVRILGGIYLLEENGIIDEIFYNRMILDYDSVKLFINT